MRRPPTPVPTFDVYWEPIHAFTLPPPPAPDHSHIHIGPRKGRLAEGIPRAPPSPVKSEDQWSTRCDIGRGKKFDYNAPSPYETSSSFAPDPDRYIIRTTTHHRSEREKENVDARTHRRRTRKVSRPEPRPEVVEHVPRHRETTRPRPARAPPPRRRSRPCRSGTRGGGRRSLCSPSSGPCSSTRS